MAVRMAPLPAVGRPGAGPPALTAPPDSITVNRRSRDLIAQPLINKCTAFTADERDELGLRGLLPPRVTTIEDDLALELEHLRRKDDDLERYIGLAALQDRNETLFYRLLADNLEELAPIVYTPTVGRACQQFSHIFRRPRGVWITPDDLEHIDDILRAAADDVRLIVVTDNERILGLGDQGAGGIAIPIGKLALYTAGAGIYPARTLPVSLDVGTDRAELLDDPLYLGHRAPRLRGEAYDTVLEAFVESVRRVFPTCVVQWEDFKQHNALRILDRFRHRLPSFNDDVQGTGAVVLGGLLAARGKAGLGSDRFLLIGSGAAGVGIARQLRHYFASEGLTPDFADGGPRVALMNTHGLVHTERTDLADDQRPVAVDPHWFAARGLTGAALSDPAAVARALGATVVIGTTGTPGTFDRELIGAVAANAATPIVLPLSNPGDRAEAPPAAILDWSAGRAIVASGSPFADVEHGGRRKVIGQANNVFIFPGVGLGAILAEAREVTDDAFLVAARELAAQVTSERRASGAIYPPISQLNNVAARIAAAVVRKLRDSGYGRAWHDEEIEPLIEQAMWRPNYLRYHYVAPPTEAAAKYEAATKPS
jgi:malic enzyme